MPQSATLDHMATIDRDIPSTMHIEPRIERIALAVLIAVSAAIGIGLAWTSVDYLVTHTMFDDGFYYLQIARNIAHGHGVSADGEVWTNGFHPLWMALLVPVYALHAGRDVSLHLSLTLSAVIVSASGGVVYATARRLGLSPVARLATVAVYLFNPIVVFMSVDGLETGVNLAAFAVMLYAYVAAWQEPTARRQLLASAAAGVLVLSRTDYGIAAALMLLVLLVRRPSVRDAANLALPAVAIVAPWFAWNMALFGSPVQGSAGSVPYVAHHVDGWDTASKLELAVESLHQLEIGARTLLRSWFTPSASWDVVTVAFMAAIVAATAAVIASSHLRTKLSILAVPAIGLALIFVVNGAIRWVVRDWYLMPALVMLAILIGFAVDAARTPSALRWAVMPMLVLLPVIAVGRTASGLHEGPYPQQLDMVAAARWIDAETPRGTRIGSFDSGILSYYSGRTTVNLDGVVNPDAASAVRKHRVAAYVRELGLDMIVDFPLFSSYPYGPFFGSPLDLTVTRTFASRPVKTWGAFTVYTIAGTDVSEPR